MTQHIAHLCVRATRLLAAAIFPAASWAAKRLLVAAVLGSSTLVAHAEFQTGRIAGYIPYSDGDRQLFFISLDTSQVDGCNVTARYAIDSGSPRFKNTMAAAMMAFHSQTPVTVSYGTTCTAWSNSHDLNYLCVGALPC